MSHTLDTVVVGAPGFAGRELISILLGHPHARLAGLFGSERQSADKPAMIADLHPRLFGRIDMPVLPASVPAIAALRPQAVFLATPHEASLELVAGLFAAAAAAGTSWKPVVFDLSAAFRLKAAAPYPKFYGFEHHEQELLADAVYGLAERNHEAITRANLIAVPGCYPTSAILPLAPLVDAGALDASRRVVIDAVSGVSGAGRTPTAKTHFSEISLQPYNVLAHRHKPEIDEHAGIRTIFTPHLVEFDRGILSTIHADLAPGWNANRVGECLRSAYAGRPFVRLLGAGKWPSVGGVRGTNFCDLGWAVDDDARHLIVVSAIDNLIKGAAGQAVQCLNLRFRLPETLGLLGGLG